MYLEFDRQKEYFGECKKPGGKAIRAQLQIKKNNIFHLLLDERINDEPMFRRIDEDILYFTSFQGFKITCIHCMSLGYEHHNGAIGRAGFQPTYLVYGDHVDMQGQWISKITLFDKNFHAFSGIDRFDNLRDFLPNGNDHTFKMDPVDLFQYSTDEATIQIHKRLSPSGGAKLKYEVDTIVSIDFKRDTGVIPAIDFLNKISLILEYIGRDRLNPQYIFLNKGDGNLGILKYRKKEKIASTIVVRNFLRHHDVAELRGIIEGIHKNFELLSVPLKLHRLSQSVFPSNIEYSLLLTVQAFEVLCRRMMANEIVGPEEFSEIRDLLKGAISALNINPMLREKIIGQIAYVNEPTLKERYRLVRNIEGLNKMFEVFGKSDDFIKTIVDKRNFYTHFSRRPKIELDARMIEKNITLVDALILYCAGVVPSKEFYKERYGFFSGIE